MPLLNGPEDQRDGGDVPTHGRDTAIYQELLVIRRKFEKWIANFRSEFPNDEFLADVELVEERFSTMEKELYVEL